MRIGPIVVETRDSPVVRDPAVSTSLGFIGVGVQPPEPGWGLDGQRRPPVPADGAVADAFPALAISTAVIGANLFGDGIGTRFAYPRRKCATYDPSAALQQRRTSRGHRAARVET